MPGKHSSHSHSHMKEREKQLYTSPAQVEIESVHMPAVIPALGSWRQEYERRG